MISELRIALGLLENSQPLTRRKGVHTARKTQVPETRYRDSFLFKELLRNSVSTVSTQLPPRAMPRATCVQVCGCPWCKPRWPWGWGNDGNVRREA